MALCEWRFEGVARAQMRWRTLAAGGAATVALIWSGREQDMQARAHRLCSRSEGRMCEKGSRGRWVCEQGARASHRQWPLARSAAGSRFRDVDKSRHESRLFGGPLTCAGKDAGVHGVSTHASVSAAPHNHVGRLPNLGQLLERLLACSVKTRIQAHEQVQRQMHRQIHRRLHQRSLLWQR